MSAAMVNVGLMRESRFRIRSLTAHAYACDTVVATRRSGERPRRWRKARGFRSPLIADDLDQHALAATAVELAIKNLLPGTEVEFARRNCDHDLSSHDLAFHMGISVVLASSVMTVTRNGLMRREPFEPGVVIGVQPPLVVVDEHRCGDVHGVDERETVSNAALRQGGLDPGVMLRNARRPGVSNQSSLRYDFTVFLRH
jgi:hypothetical protein